jgi:CRISPR-associated protein Cst2
VNLFASVLTYPAPSANYRGESELNRTVIQKVTDGRFDYAIISPEAMRNALREILASYGLPCNRKRIEQVAGDEKPQLAVKFAEFPDPTKFADDFIFGYLLAIKGKDLDNLRSVRGKAFPVKRDSVLRMNLAKSLEPYRHSTVFTQSPKLAKDNPWKVGEAEGGTSSALLHRETVVSAFQYPFALNLDDCAAVPEGKKWTRALLRAIGELNDVAGNHARSYFEMAPASIVVRLTKSLVAGYGTYGFQADPQRASQCTFPEVIDGILHERQREGEPAEPKPDYPGKEFYLGGKLVKDMKPEAFQKLQKQGVTLERDPRRLLEVVADRALGGD